VEADVAQFVFDPRSAIQFPEKRPSSRMPLSDHDTEQSIYSAAS
jgi:hypothetical protein